MGAHPESIGHFVPLPRSPFTTTAVPPTILFVVPQGERGLYDGDQFTRHYVHTGADALKMLASARPRLLVLDWDDASLGRQEVSTAACAVAGTSVLVITAAVENVPAILRAGCQGVLLKPFATSILAGRIGRVLKETERASAPRKAAAPAGTNRVWPNVACPNCGTQGVTSFDFSSYRRMWYACLSCDATWLGRRRE